MSSINPNNIDGTYPIAGQDNDSQGFRDNFTNIKNNFQFAYDELTDLQSKVVLKSALSGGSINNDMNYAQLISPQLLRSVETRNDLGNKSGSFNISWADAHYQYFAATGDCTLGFTNWPTSGYYTKLRIQITTPITSDVSITFPTGVKEDLGLLRVHGYQGSQTVRLERNNKYLFELTTVDAGSNIAIEDLFRSPADVTTYLAPTANVSVTANIGVQRVHFTPTGVATVSFGAYVTMPNANVNATTVSISSNVGISQLSITPNTGCLVDPSANVNLSAGQAATYQFRKADNTWYKVG